MGYRPIVMLNEAGKMLERIVAAWLVSRGQVDPRDRTRWDGVLLSRRAWCSTGVSPGPPCCGISASTGSCGTSYGVPSPALASSATPTTLWSWLQEDTTESLPVWLAQAWYWSSLGSEGWLKVTLNKSQTLLFHGELRVVTKCPCRNRRR